ncbi:hypothetical protein JD844_017068 [Phrynosoma platyrhinos]|uniref:Monocyte differentiation antigen CD14 n=1 Tax=Phrynosoma platyrhinos TaxID=52577 RepID=A0ABQ7SL61_PHRPL|nr:hypothetical protein JD844_017068 [Phrynosoma platyrhinos]
MWCKKTTTYELRGGNLAQFAGFSRTELKSDEISFLEALQVSKLIFTELIVPEVLLPVALKIVSYTPQVSELKFINCTFLRSADQLDTDGLDLKVSSLHFHKVMAPPLDDRVDISSLRSWLEILENLQNDFLPKHLSSPCVWPPSLRVFNLSSTGFKHIDRSLPPDIEILDLSANHIFTLDLSIPGLKELYLSNNRLQTIPSVKGLPSLEVLSLDHNQLSQLPTEGLLHLKNLHSLKAGHNLYNCSCRRTIKEIQDLATSKASLPDWPHDYICSSPPDYQDYVLNEVPLSSLQCSKAATVRQESVVPLLTCLHLVLALVLLPAYGTQPIVL